MELGKLNKTTIGITFGYLTIFNIFRKDRITYAECICECGECYVGMLQNIKKGKSSCGKCQARNKHVYNKSFFMSTSPERNYVIGLLGADGSIEKNRINLTLKSTDIDILHEINSLICDDIIVHKKNVKHSYSQHALRISSKEIVNIISKFGIHKNKSMNFQVHDEFMYDPDFWRGMIDGDGYVSFNDKKLLIGICGTIDVCNKFLDFCKRYTDTKACVYFEPSKTNKNFGRAKISGTHALSIGKIIYKNANNLKIKRKHDKFMDACNMYILNRNLQFDKVFMNIADQISTLSRAVRAKVGAIIVDDNLNIVSTGYNGTPRGFDNSAEYITDNGNLKTKAETLHAESNAIAKISRSTVSSDNATMYVTLSPCLQCAKLIIQSGIKKVLFRDVHCDSDGMDGINLLIRAGIEVTQLNN